MVGGPPALGQEERLLQATAREFAQREVAPTAIERDETERFDRSIFTRMGELGLTAAPIPESEGGAGFSYLGWTLVMEELGAADMATAVTLSVHILSQLPVVTWGTDEQKTRWLPAMLAGDALGAFALTEPHAGSDAAALRCAATKAGPEYPAGGYVISGSKSWVTHGGRADFYTLFARTGDGSRGISCFLVPGDLPGLSFGKPEEKMGLHAVPTTAALADL